MISVLIFVICEGYGYPRAGVPYPPHPMRPCDQSAYAVRITDGLPLFCNTESGALEPLKAIF